MPEVTKRSDIPDLGDDAIPVDGERDRAMEHGSYP